MYDDNDDDDDSDEDDGDDDDDGGVDDDDDDDDDGDDDDDEDDDDNDADDDDDIDDDGGDDDDEMYPGSSLSFFPPRSFSWKARSAKDLVARTCFVGIFITENLLHATYFELEVDAMVAPALALLPREVAADSARVHGSPGPSLLHAMPLRFSSLFPRAWVARVTAARWQSTRAPKPGPVRLR